MPDTSTDILLESLVEALQTFAFISVEPVLDQVAAPASADLYTLGFDGCVCGQFQMAAPRALGCLMAANLLGLEPSDPQVAASAQDVVKELCNIVTGLWLRHRPPEETPEMGLPTAVALADWDGFASRPGAMLILAEGFALAVRMEVTS